MAVEFCPICGRLIDGGHKCKLIRTRRIEDFMEVKNEEQTNDKSYSKCPL